MTGEIMAMSHIQQELEFFFAHDDHFLREALFIQDGGLQGHHQLRFFQLRAIGELMLHAQDLQAVDGVGCQIFGQRETKLALDGIFDVQV